MNGPPPQDQYTGVGFSPSFGYKCQPNYTDFVFVLEDVLWLMLIVPLNGS